MIALAKGTNPTSPLTVVNSLVINLDTDLFKVSAMYGHTVSICNVGCAGSEYLPLLWGTLRDSVLPLISTGCLLRMATATQSQCAMLDALV